MPLTDVVRDAVGRVTGAGPAVLFWVVDPVDPVDPAESFDDEPGGRHGLQKHL